MAGRVSRAAFAYRYCLVSLECVNCHSVTLLRTWAEAEVRAAGEERSGKINMGVVLVPRTGRNTSAQVGAASLAVEEDSLEVVKQVSWSVSTLTDYE